MTEKSVISIAAGMVVFILLGNAVGGLAGDNIIEETSKVFDQCKTNPEKF